MKRVLMTALGACAAVAIAASHAAAASPEVEAAIKTVNTVGGDAAKLKSFCEFYKLLESVGDKEDAETEGKLESALNQVGEDFVTAWETGVQLDESSADGKEFYAALDALAEKCESGD